MIHPKATWISVLISALAVTVLMSANAAVSNLESYHLRHDFSTGKRVFSGGEKCTADFIHNNASETVAVAGPDGPCSAMHLGNCSGNLTINGTVVDDAYLDANAWALAMSFRPGNVEKGMLFQVGRMNGGNNSGRISIVVCSSSDPSKLYVQEFYRGDSSTTPELGNSVELTGLRDMPGGFHSFVMVYDPSEKTITPYVDGTRKAVLTLSSKTTTTRKIGNYLQYGSFSSLNAMPSGFSQSYTNTDVAFYDLRFYLGSLDADDAARYATMYPASPFSPLGAYANVESFGVNAVDTGYKANKNSQFRADFKLERVAKQNRVFGTYRASSSTEGDQDTALYINGNLEFAFVMSCVNKGHWKSTGVGADDNTRHLFTLSSTSTTAIDGSLYDYDAPTVRLNESAHTDTGVKLTKDSTRNIFLFSTATANIDSNDTFSKAKMYSFQISESGTLAHFFAPDSKNGVAGFTDVVTGLFHDDEVESPATVLAYTDGYGRATDYRYRDGTFSARVYAKSADASKGTVKFEGGIAAETAAQFVARGKTATITAVPAEGFGKVVWSGDTWAIVERQSFSITVKSDTAACLTATFCETPVWKNTDGTGSFDSVANWKDGVKPESGEGAIIDLDGGDAAITVAGAFSLANLAIKNGGTVTFSGNGTISASKVTVGSGTMLATGGVVSFDAFDGEGSIVYSPGAADELVVDSETVFNGDLKIVTDKSITVTLNAAVSVKTLTVAGAVNAVVTISNGTGGSFVATSGVIVESGVLKQGSAGVLGATPTVTVENGGTFDVNNLAPDRSTTFSIAGAGAGDWPWALTSSANVTSDNNSIDIVSLAGDATIGGDVQMCIGVRSGATFNATTQTLPLTLNGHTLTKTGTGTLWFRRPYSTNEGTIDVQSGTLRINGWTNANAAYAQSCVSNIVLILRDGAAAKSELNYPLYFKSLDVRGGTLSSSTGAFGVNEVITLDPIRNPIGLQAAPAFASGAKVVLADSYADVTCGKLVLLTWSGAGEVTLPTFDASCVGGAPDGLTVETASDGVSRLFLRVGGYEQNAKAIRIAPIGDSITQGVTKDSQGDYPQYRSSMAAHLAAHGYKPTLCGIWKYANLDRAGAPVPDEWAWHTGVSGDAIVATDKSGGVMDNLHLYLDAIGKPDVITLLVGTNDMGRNGKSAEETYVSWTNLVWEIVRQRPTVKIVASTVLDRKDNTDGVKAKVAAFNALLKADVNAGNLPANLSLVDLFDAVPLATAGNFFTDELHPNWQGHALMAKGFADGIMSACPYETFTPTVDDTVTNEAQSPLGASGIDQLADYRRGFRHVYTIDAAETNAFPNSGIAPYTATNAVLRSGRKLAKVGYYMELVRKGTNRRRWVWVDMDASGKTLDEVALPWNANTERPRQFIAEKLHVKSNDGAVHAVAPTDDTVSGVFEGTPYNYSAGGTTAQLVGAPANLMTGGYGWNDDMTGTSSGFGCFQMHRIFTAEQKAAAGIPHDAEVLFAWNRWGSSSSGNADDIGIGTYACHAAGIIDSPDKEGNLDYTQTANGKGNLADTVSAKAYQVRRIEIWAKEQSKGVMILAK